jgi:hypothetical protein
LAACSAIASASWLMAMSGERPSAISMPVDAPPPPAKESTMISAIGPEPMGAASAMNMLMRDQTFGS